MHKVLDEQSRESWFVGGASVDDAELRDPPTYYGDSLGTKYSGLGKCGTEVFASYTPT